MPNSADHDIRRAKDYRRLARDAKDPQAKRDFNDAADRLERRAAQKARKVGRKKRRSPNSGITAAPPTR